MIGQEMRLSAFEVEGIRVAGLLHDIGKSAIPNELLSKYGHLTAEEYALIKTHAARADGLLFGIDFPWPVREMILQHHERMDGSGYPNGLMGNEICLGARILAVSDITDAMMNARPYRGALGIEKVISELADNSHLYDPDVCKAFMAIVADGGERLKNAIHIIY
ncbi:HD domain-containing protein [Shewanella sp. 1180_01]